MCSLFNKTELRHCLELAVNTFWRRAESLMVDCVKILPNSSNLERHILVGNQIIEGGEAMKQVELKEPTVDYRLA